LTIFAVRIFPAMPQSTSATLNKNNSTQDIRYQVTHLCHYINKLEEIIYCWWMRRYTEVVEEEPTGARRTAAFLKYVIVIDRSEKRTYWQERLQRWNCLEF
jgi:hypothetical protein